MKKLLSIALCLCALLSLAAPALAAADGAPPRWLYDTEEDYQNALDQWQTQQPEPEPEPEPDPVPSLEPQKPVESAGESNAVDSSPPRVDHNSADKYPVGSYVDSSGQVWSPSGQLLSPDTVPASEAVAPDALPPDALGGPDSAEAPAVDPDTLTVIAGLVSDIATDPPVWSVEDLRPEDTPAEVLSGLKALVTSIFGEYTPVTTTSVVSQTVGNDTQQYLVETVAPGAAGVDYEWLAGVLLFAILLFCLMRLLGGVLK